MPPEIVQSVRFYNGGDHKEERMQYSALEFDKTVENGVRYFCLDAPRKGFFDVPRELRLEEGAAQLLGLPREVMEKYGERGFVMVDKNLSDEKCVKEPFMSNSDEAGRAKGDELWRKFCFAKITEYENNDQERIARGMAKARPSGFIIHCYKELGMVPPAAEEHKKAIEGQNTIDELKASNLRLQEQLTEIMRRMPIAIAEVPPEPPARKGR